MEQITNDTGRKRVFEALVKLKEALEYGIVTADDILGLISSKLNEYERQPGPNRGPRQSVRKTDIHVHHHHRYYHSGGNGSEQKVRIECRYCHGLGRWRSERPCPVCGGARLILIPAGYVECASCFGLGQWEGDEPCKTCSGTGHIPVRNY